MKVFVFYWIKALITLVVGFLMLLFPQMFASWFGVELAAGGSMLAQLLGAGLIGIAFICYYASRSESALTARNILLGLAVMDSLGFLVLLLGQIGAVMNGVGIVLLIIWALFAMSAWIYWVIGGRTV